MPERPDPWTGNPGDNASNTIDGTGNDDAIEGTANADIIDAGLGNDTVNAGDGHDVIYGGQGNDDYDGGDGIDTIIYSSATLPVEVDLMLGTGDGSEVGTDSLSNIENIVGGSGDDELYGDDSDNFIAGGGGSDVIDGRSGSDVAVFAGLVADYNVVLRTDGTVEVGISADVTILNNIEWLMFDDAIVATTDLTPESGGGPGSGMMTGSGQLLRPP